MEPTTLRLQEDTIEKLSEEAEQHGFGSRADYVRFLIEHRATTLEHAEDEPAAAPIVERVDELESIVEDLRAEIDTAATTTDGGPERALSTNSARTIGPEPEPDRSDTPGDESPSDRVSAIESALAEFAPKSRDSGLNDRAREIGKAVCLWLADEGELRRKSDFVDLVEPDHQMQGQSPDSWWTETARPALDRAADHDLVEKVGRRYRWIGP